ncbi:hypothetical protein ACK3SF_05075 [Candidatus Nanosalina sp. VS9-1]|uniref:hypothetical protein n=1 Tax=Candidatus Nanosalina sp. VS9-1 TaxID=3388566 RepID=UPI0039E075DB
MREHAKKALKHDTKVLGKTVPTMLLIGLFLAGSGSAALLTTFGTVSGTADVDQAVTFADDSTEVTSSFDGEVVAGSTYQDEFTLVNDANRTATVEFVSDADDIGGISQEVTGVTQSFTLYDTEDAGNSWAQGDATEKSVEVTPYSDRVVYEMSFENDPAYANLEISRGSEDNFQVSWADGFSVIDPSTSGDTADISAVEKVESASYDSQTGEFEVVVSRETGQNQSFAAHAQLGEPFETSVVTENNFDSTGAIYSDTSTDHHEQISFDQVSNYVDSSQVDLAPNSTSAFELETDFDVALDPSPAEVESNPGAGEVLDEYFDGSSYVVDLEVQPVTQ